jgi:hypothetical protein
MRAPSIDAKPEFEMMERGNEEGPAGLRKRNLHLQRHKRAHSESAREKWPVASLRIRAETVEAEDGGKLTLPSRRR